MAAAGSINEAKFSLNTPLSTIDPELYGMLRDEKKRQRESIILIASENYASRAVLETLSSSTSNKYSEGAVGARYYGGNEHIDRIEKLCIDRALAAFHLSPDRWGVNVQALSGSPANMAVYTGVLGPHGRLMGLDLPDGGHLTHGFASATKKVSASSMFFESMPYKVDPATGLIDYDQLQRSALLFRPKLIVAGFSCYSRALDWPRFRKIADSVNAFLMADIAHIAGLVAAGVISSPFELCDIVTTTTHKTLRGPRSALIFYRRGVRSKNAAGVEELYDLERKINDAVFPGLQGGPHNNNIAAVAVALGEALRPEFVEYQQQIVRNCKALCTGLAARGYSIFTGGSDNHLLLVDLRPLRVDGATVEHALELCNVSVNKNAIPGEKNVLRPFGLRLGTPAITSRGMKEADVEQVADVLDAVLKLLVRLRDELSVKATAGKKEPSAYVLGGKEFKAFLEGSGEAPAGRAEYQKAIADIKQRVAEFVAHFPAPGLEDL